MTERRVGVQPTAEEWAQIIENKVTEAHGAGKLSAEGKDSLLRAAPAIGLVLSHGSTEGIGDLKKTSGGPHGGMGE